MSNCRIWAGRFKITPRTRQIFYGMFPQTHTIINCPNDKAIVNRRRKYLNRFALCFLSLHTSWLKCNAARSARHIKNKTSSSMHRPALRNSSENFTLHHEDTGNHGSSFRTQISKIKNIWAMTLSQLQY